MEIFKSDTLEKEFRRFEEQDLIKILECGYCEFHTKFLVSCKFCREMFLQKLP